MDREQMQRCLEEVAAYRASGQKSGVWAAANGVPARVLASWCANSTDAHHLFHRALKVVPWAPEPKYPLHLMPNAKRGLCKLFPCPTGLHGLGHICSAVQCAHCVLFGMTKQP